MTFPARYVCQGSEVDIGGGEVRCLVALMAEGRSNAGIARRLWGTEGTVEKHVGSSSPSPISGDRGGTNMLAGSAARPIFLCSTRLGWRRPTGRLSRQSRRRGCQR